MTQDTSGGPPYDVVAHVICGVYVHLAISDELLFTPNFGEVRKFNFEHVGDLVRIWGQRRCLDDTNPRFYRESAHDRENGRQTPKKFHIAGANAQFLFSLADRRRRYFFVCVDLAAGEADLGRMVGEVVGSAREHQGRTVLAVHDWNQDSGQRRLMVMRGVVCVTQLLSEDRDFFGKVRLHRELRRKSMGEFVNLEVSDGVGVIRLDRPPMNALSRSVIAELWEVSSEVGLSEEVGAVVLWGGPNIFAAGADINEFTSSDAAGIFHYGKYLQDAFTALAEIPKVTIAAVNGFALGGGCELALTADFRFAAEDAQLGQPEIMLGLIPGAGGTQRLPRLVGVSRAKEMIFLGKPVGAEEALRIGLVNRVFAGEQVFDKAVAAAERYAKGPLVALKAAKLAIDRGIEADIDTGLAVERGAFATLFGTQDCKIGVASFFEKGPGKAEFVGR